MLSSLRLRARWAPALSLPLLLGCGSERPPPCAAATCGLAVDVPQIGADRPDSDAGAALDAPEVAPSEAAVEDRPASPEAAVEDRPAPPMDVPTDVSADVPRDVLPEAAEDIPLDVPQDPPVTSTRTDLGTRGIVASLPCGDVLRHLEVQVTPRTVPANSFELRVRNASPNEVISVWYNATLNADWNLESLAPDLAPGMSVTMSLWRVSGSPAWYVLGISRTQHFYINDSGIFVELPCGRAARNTTQTFRRTITP